MKKKSPFKESSVTPFVLFFFFGITIGTNAFAQCNVISNCDNLTNWTGVSSSTTTFLEGSGAALWDHFTANKIVYDAPLDLSGKKGISFWMHSNGNWNQNVVFILSSENPAQPLSDYYRKDIRIDFTGWKKIRIDLADLIVSRSPRGLDQIDNIQINATGWGNTLNPSIELIVDDIRGYNRLENSRQLSSCDNLTGWSNASKLELTTDRKEGSNAIYWDFEQTGEASYFPEVCDFSDNLKLTFWVKNNINNNQNMRVLLDRPNPASTGNDYYIRDFRLDFVGWKKIEIKLSIFSPAGQPQGRDQIEKILFLANSWSAPITDNKIIIDDLKLEGTSEDYDINAAILSPHPRIYVNDWDAFKLRVDNDPEMKAISTTIISKATSFLNTSVKPYLMSPEGRLMDVSGDLLQRVTHLACAYNLTKDSRFLNKAYDDLESVVNFPSWNPSHFLDVGIMTFGVAIGYDWLYNDLSPIQRETIRNGIKTLGCETYLEQCDKGVWWHTTKTNWSGVSNGGVGVGALAIAETDPYLSQTVINKAYEGLLSENGLIDGYAPDGASPEAPAYWEFQTTYLINFMAAMESSVNNSFGLLDRPGMEKTGAFPIFMVGAKGDKVFNYADNSGDRPINTPALFFLGDHFDNDLLRWYQKKHHKSSVLDLVWYPSKEGVNPTESNMDRDAYFRDTEVATFRTSWDDPNAKFLGFLAGNNKDGHSQLDIGCFIFDSHGVRWIQELGRESYSKTGYLAYNAWDSERYKFYRAKAEGNNTIVLNPYKLQIQGYTADQDPFAKAEIIQFKGNNGNEGNVIADLTDAYDEFGATSVKRGVAFINNREQVILQDEIKMSEASSYWSFMNTPINPADIMISADGRKATMIKDGKQLVCEILEPFEATFQKMVSEQLPGLPEPTAGESVTGSKIAINLEGITETTIRVLLSPGEQGAAADYTTPPLYALDDPLWPEGIASCTLNAACDDSNPCTINDKYNENCECLGKIVSECTAGINENESVSINVFPNPSDGNFIITNSGFEDDAIIRIYSASGKLVWKKPSNSMKTTVNAEDWDKGLYIIQIRSERTRMHKKIVLR